MKWRSYPAYKDSNVEWLGEIPEHWSFAPVKRGFEIQLGKMLQNKPESESDILVHYIKALHVLWGIVETHDLPEMWASPTDITHFDVKGGDLLVCEGGEAGRAGILMDAPSPCIIQNAVHRVREKGCDARFLQYVLETVKSSGWFDVLCNKATIAHFTREKLAALRMPKPLSDDQQAIASFLDRETARIDALIEKKQRQIELLQEKRAALISHAVTKGLNPDAKMKDSGIEWLGEIPAHWVLKPIKYLTKILRGKFTHRPRNDPKLYDGPYPFIQTGDVAAAYKFIREYHQTLNEKGLAVSKMFPKGTLVMTIAANIGDMAVLDFEACFPDSIVGFVPTENVELDFLYYLFQGLRQLLLSTATLNTQLNLNIDRIGSLFAAEPPKEEQVSIIQYLEEGVERSVKIENKILQSISKLQEYRTALISAAVTGKIDVRGGLSHG